MSLVDLRDYLRVLRSRWLLIAVITLVAVGAAAGATLLTTPLYKSTTTVFVSAGDAQSNLGSAYTGSLLSQQRVSPTSTSPDPRRSPRASWTSSS